MFFYRVTYGCDQCGKRFPVRSTLNKHHIKIHGTRLYAKNNTTLTVNNSPENNTCIMENNPGLAENIPGPSDDNSCLTENNTRLPENNNSCSAENNLCQTNDKVSSVENKLSSKGKIFESTENDTKEYRCFICNNQFESFELLLIHQTCRHNNGIVPISNEMDNKTDDHNLSCFLCQNRYKRFAWLISHQKTKHKEHIIENDNTTKTLPSTLKNRPRKVYKPKSYACFICSDDFPSFCTLLNHQIDYHSNGIISESNLSLTDNNLSSIGHDSALLVNNLPTTEKTPTLTENNLSTTGNNLTLTEKNLPTTGNIVTFTENNSNSELYEHSCFLCDKRYKRFDTLLLHQRDKHKDKRMTFS